MFHFVFAVTARATRRWVAPDVPRPFWFAVLMAEMIHLLVFMRTGVNAGKVEKVGRRVTKNARDQKLDGLECKGF